MFHRLSLEQLNEPISIIPAKPKDGVAEYQHSIVGKFLTDRPINMTAAKNTTIRAWNSRYPVSIMELEYGFLLFKFNSSEEMKRVLNNQPWSFNGHPLLMLQWRPDILVSELKLSRLPLWVKVHGIPPEYLTHEVGTTIASNLGQLEEVDIPKRAAVRGKYLRIRVHMDVDLPLRPYAVLQLLSIDPTPFPLTYEKLPTVCYHYRRIGHDERHCNDLNNAMSALNLFGPWLRAELFHPESWPKHLAATVTGSPRKMTGEVFRQVEDGDSQRLQGRTEARPQQAIPNRRGTDNSDERYQDGGRIRQTPDSKRTPSPSSKRIQITDDRWSPQDLKSQHQDTLTSEVDMDETMAVTHFPMDPPHTRLPNPPTLLSTNPPTVHIPISVMKPIIHTSISIMQPTTHTPGSDTLPSFTKPDKDSTNTKSGPPLKATSKAVRAQPKRPTGKPSGSIKWKEARPQPFTALLAGQMIDDQDLGFFANFLGIFIFVLVIAYHYVMADPKYEGS
ncbi:hypothetical protein HHK36_010961 [Tetracentron sinense]|uniref:DUF4283 domain-containing protein n=1 Tax=Tetracentron sinense TaxID=13715 RepID=A0A834Z8A3_TETSI|nr:hypothetical protein HHK36_010961 [Tetracentron sinense]